MARAGISRPIPIGSPAAIQALRADWAATVGVPTARARFDVYAPPDAVRFAKRPCRPADTQFKFIPHTLPVRARHLLRSQRALGFQNLDFAFADRDGVLFEDRCWVRVPLPPTPWTGSALNHSIPPANASSGRLPCPCVPRTTENEGLACKSPPPPARFAGRGDSGATTRPRFAPARYARRLLTLSQADARFHGPSQTP